MKKINRLLGLGGIAIITILWIIYFSIPKCQQHTHAHEEFGDIANDSLDDSKAIELCANSGHPCTLSKGNYRVRKSIVLKSGCVINGNNATISTNGSNPIFIVTGSYNRLINFKLVGNNINLQCGIEVGRKSIYDSVALYNMFYGIRFVNLGRGIIFNNVYKSMILGCDVNRCEIGISLNSLSKSTTISNCSIYNSKLHPIKMLGDSNLLIESIVQGHILTDVNSHGMFVRNRFID